MSFCNSGRVRDTLS